MREELITSAIFFQRTLYLNSSVARLITEEVSWSRANDYCWVSLKFWQVQAK